MPAEFLSGHTEKIVLLILKSNLLLWKMYAVFLIVNFDQLQPNLLLFYHRCFDLWLN